MERKTFGRGLKAVGFSGALASALGLWAVLYNVRKDFAPELSTKFDPNAYLKAQELNFSGTWGYEEFAQVLIYSFWGLLVLGIIGAIIKK